MSTKQKAKIADSLGELYDDMEALKKEKKEIMSRIRAKNKEINVLLASINKKEEEEEED